MSTIAITMNPPAQAVLARLEKLPTEMQKSTMEVLDLENELTTGHIQEHYLSQRGPDTLGVRTNFLRKSIHPTKAVVVGESIESAIGSNIRYAGVHEFGFHGTVTVREHKRPTKKGASVTVRAHDMRMHIKARAPIRHGIQDRVGDYRKALGQAIVTTWNEGRGGN